MSRATKTPKQPSISRAFLSDNVQSLMAVKYQDIPAVTNRIKALASDAGCGYGTIKRLIAEESGTTLDTIEGIASALDVLPYQLLIHDLDPNNPQIVNGAGIDEKRFYALLRRSKPLSRKQ